MDLNSLGTELKRLRSEIVEHGALATRAVAADADLLLSRATKPEDPRVARPPFRSAENNFRKALGHLDEVLADIERAQRDIELSKLET